MNKDIHFGFSFMADSCKVNMQRRHCFQIVGEIKAARNALVEVTSRLRSYLYREFFQKDSTPPSFSASGSLGSGMGLESSSPSRTPVRDGYTANDPPSAIYQNAQTVAAAQASKVSLLQASKVSLLSSILLILVSLIVVHFFLISRNIYLCSSCSGKYLSLSS